MDWYDLSTHNGVIKNSRAFYFDQVAIKKEKDIVVFIAQAIFPLLEENERKTAYFLANGDCAEILNGICGEGTVFDDVKSQDFNTFPKISAERTIITIEEGDSFLEKTPFDLEQRYISSVREVRDLKTLKSFQLMQASVRYAFLGQIVGIAHPYFYDGCTELRCNQKKVCKQEDGNYHCSKCRSTLSKPMPSVAVTVTVEHDGATVEASLYSKEIIPIAGVESIPDLQKLGLEEIKKRLYGRNFVFLVRHAFYEREFETIPVWHITIARPAE